MPTTKETLDTLATIRIPGNWLRQLKKLARRRSAEQDTDISWQRLVRDAIASQLLQQS